MAFASAFLDIALIVAAALLFIVGIIGCVIPGIPGTPLCWGGLLVGHFVSRTSLPWPVLIGTALVCVAVEIVNNLVPSYFTRKSGGSKAGSTGAIVGVFVGMFTGQILLILLGPFIGALVGELFHDYSDFKKAFRSACYSFLGFLTGTGLRLIVAAIFVVVFIRSFFS